MTQNQALTILKTGKNVFLTGEPGSGKTYLINKYISYLYDHDIRPAITASTGIAATHIGGLTIHSWSGIGIAKEVTENDLKRLMKNEKLVERIKKTKVLIIDEISMLSAETLNLAEKVIRKVKESEEPFGGMQVILVGDFFQLPPVSSNSKPHFAFESAIWEKLDPTVCYLTEQHRQEDQDFLSLLSAIRRNSIEESHYLQLENRVRPFMANKNNLTKLYSHNADVDSINIHKLTSLPGETHTFIMDSFGKRKYIPALIKGCLSPEELELKIDAIVMFTKNNPREGYVNGTLGTVIGFDEDKGYPIVKTNTGSTFTVGPASWAVEENGIDVATITQIPLRLAWAITIHKSQGMSLDAAVIDLRLVFEFGQGYVALSRVRGLSGLHLLGFNENSLLVHPDILVKDREFRSMSGKAFLNLSQLTDEAINENFKEFISRVNGSLEKISKDKILKTKTNTYEETLKLAQTAKSITAIAKERNLTESTIINHLEKLIDKNMIDQETMINLLPKKLVTDLPIIQAMFTKLETTKLTPVHEAFKHKYSFEELRIARTTLEVKTIPKSL